MFALLSKFSKVLVALVVLAGASGMTQAPPAQAQALAVAFNFKAGPFFTANDAAVVASGWSRQGYSTRTVRESRYWYVYVSRN